MSMASITVRDAEPRDLARIVDIYNHYVLNSHVTFDVTPVSIAHKTQWFAAFSPEGPHRALVALDGDEVVGYATTSRLREKPAYSVSVETTIYVAADQHGRGAGAALYETLLTHIDEVGVHRAWAAIALPNESSVAFHERFGFELVGVFREVGYKFDRYWDVAWYGRPAGGAAVEPAV